MNTNNQKTSAPLNGELEHDNEFQARTGPSKLVYIVIAILCVIYIINPTAGFIEFLPDNLPIIGNLDEATATTGLLYALSGLGLIPWSRK